MNEKRCFKCGEVKPLSEFYVHAQMKDGHINKCIECTKAERKQHEAKEPAAIYQTRLKTFSKRPTKRNGYKLIEAALKAKVITRPHNCTICNKPDTESRIEAHHYDYTKPLEVTWLCPECHYQADELRRKREGTQNGNKKAVAMMKDGEVIARFESIQAAANAVGVCRTSIFQCLTGETKKSAGYEWEYVGDAL